MIALGLGTLVALSILEMSLRLFQPFPILVRGGRLELPVNTEVRITGHGFAAIDDPVEIQYNSLGFRGPELPAESESRLKILCVGGSTTQCAYLSEGKTWPDQLALRLQDRFPNVWINNAGLDGHSTYGHAFLLDQISWLQPQVILFYVGINDVDRDDLNKFDQVLDRSEPHQGEGLWKTSYRYCLGKSELLATIDTLRRQQMAKRRGLFHHASVGHGDLSSVPLLDLTNAQRQRRIDGVSADTIDAYENRLRGLIAQSRAINSIPVLLTQPALFGEGVDPVTGLDLKRCRVGEDDGDVAWRKLQIYNQATRAVAEEGNVLCIDVASEFPKSSEWFYDLFHNTSAGAERLSEIIAPPLSEFLGQAFPESIAGDPR